MREHRDTASQGASARVVKRLRKVANLGTLSARRITYRLGLASASAPIGLVSIEPEPKITQFCEK